MQTQRLEESSKFDCMCHYESKMWVVAYSINSDRKQRLCKLIQLDTILLQLVLVQLKLPVHAHSLLSTCSLVVKVV